MLVSISITAYNEEENIGKSLLSALRQSHKPIEVFLIDNASGDKTIQRAKGAYEKSASDVSFFVIKNSENLGFGGGHNAGFKNSSGEAVLCLNADCELDKDYVKYALEVMKNDSEVGAVQGKLINRKTKKIDTAGLVIFKNRRVVNRGQGEKDTGKYEASEEIWGVDGAAPLYRREALEDTKIPILVNSHHLYGISKFASHWEYFDEDFFAYKEDVDLSWRMRSAGWKMYYEPRALAFHDRSAGEGAGKGILHMIRARKNIGEFAKFHSFANQRLMQIKNESPSIFLKHAPVIFLKELFSWPYVLLFEPHGFKSAVKFLRLFGKMIRKRKFVMNNKRISDKDMSRWFL